MIQSAPALDRDVFPGVPEGAAIGFRDAKCDAVAVRREGWE